MTEATTKQAANTSVEVTRSGILSRNLVSEKARIALPRTFDMRACGEIEDYVGKMASKGLNAKDRYDILLVFEGRKPTRHDHVAVVASIATKNGETSVKNSRLEKIVDKMAEEISRIVASNVTEITIRQDASLAELKDVFPQSKDGYTPRFTGRGW